MTRNTYSYRSFNTDNGGSELETIRAQIVKQEVTRIIRKQERERISAMLEQQNKPQPKEFVMPDWGWPIVRGVFGFLMLAGVVTIIVGLTKLLL